MYLRRTADSLDVDVRGTAVLLATDGEVGRRGTRFRFGTDPRGLVIHRARP